MSYQPTEGYHLVHLACSKCHRFVNTSDVRPVAYHAAAGWNGGVDDGHDSHPACGEGVLVDVVIGRFIPIKEATP